MNHWLVKSEPETFSWQDLVKKGSACWDGVRNYAARNNLKAMKKGDKVLFYHSVQGTSVAGIAKVSREFYPDPTSKDDDRWVAVDIVPLKELKKQVPLSLIKETPALKDIYLVRQGRLSVMPLKKEEFDLIVKMGS
jgi:predicted RNA-binding protein with PUA-like domain